jgi:hypothetical protein
MIPIPPSLLLNYLPMGIRPPPRPDKEAIERGERQPVVAKFAVDQEVG